MWACVKALSITCSWAEKVLVLSFFYWGHMWSVSEPLLIISQMWAKGEIKLKTWTLNQNPHLCVTELLYYIRLKKIANKQQGNIRTLLTNIIYWCLSSVWNLRFVFPCWFLRLMGLWSLIKKERETIVSQYCHNIQYIHILHIYCCFLEPLLIKKSNSPIVYNMKQVL